jgi:hypothetical protein
MKKISNFLDSYNFNLFNKYVYNKGVLREKTVTNNQKSIILDTNDFLVLTSVTDKIKLNFNNNLKLYYYNSKSLNLFSFELNRLSFSNSYKSLITNFNRVLFCLNELNNLKTNSFYVLIIKPKKGGFTCYYNGILGFLPKYKFFFYAYKLINNFINLSSKSKFSYLNSKTLNSNLSLKFPISRIKTQIYPLYKKKKRKSKFHHNNKFSIKFNILFG